MAVHEKLIVSNKTEETATEKQTGDWIARENGGRRTRLVVAGGGLRGGGGGVNRECWEGSIAMHVQDEQRATGCLMLKVIA